MNSYTSQKRKRTYFSRPLTERFWERVKKTKGCWLWTGILGNHGYGVIFISKRPKAIFNLAHRLSWELHSGPIPEGMQVLHKCDIRPCINPAHLFLGTQKDNIHDMMRKRRGPGKLSDEQILAIRSSNVPSRKMATILGVSKTTVLDARRGKTWKSVNP